MRQSVTFLITPCCGINMMEVTAGEENKHSLKHTFFAKTLMDCNKECDTLCDVDETYVKFMNVEYAFQMDILKFEKGFLQVARTTLQDWQKLRPIVPYYKPFKPCQKCHEKCNRIQTRRNCAIKDMSRDQHKFMEETIDLIEQGLVKLKEHVESVKLGPPQIDAIIAKKIQRENC